MVTEEQLIALYEDVVGEVPLDAGAAIRQKLAPIVARPYSTRSGLPAYPTLFAKVASVVEAIVYEKPFPQENRGVAWRYAQQALAHNGYHLAAEAQEVERLMYGVELGITRSHRITLWLKQHTRRP